MIAFRLNGQATTYDGDPAVSLLSYLRNDRHLTAAKDGCSGQAACGACLVELNGKACLACSTPMSKVTDGDVVTLEGLPETLRRTLGMAFVNRGAVQCGFCTPGFLMRAKVLLQTNPNPTREEVVKAVRPHLCRCTGYVKLVDAILDAATLLPEGNIPEPDDNPRLGSGWPKYGGYERAVGTRPFVNDIDAPGMAHGAIVFSEHPRARVLAIHTDEAADMPGVVRILTADDIPGERVLGLYAKDWPVYIKVGEVTRYIGDALACVVAETEAEARAAAACVKVDYEVLTPLLDMEEAETSPIHIHENGNILLDKTIRRGEPVDEALARCAFTAEATYRTQAVEHAFIEPEATLAVPEAGGVRLYVQSQGIWHDKTDIAALLHVPTPKVTVTLADSGGAFGGKEDFTCQPHAALAAYLLGRPVKVRLSRPESIRMHPKRHGMKLHYVIGCDAKGILQAAKVRIIADTGAYASAGGPVVTRTGTHATSVYHIPSVDVHVKAVFTNNLPAGAFRGFGVNQSNFAMECLIDELCEKGGFDRWQFRYDNAVAPGRMVTTGQVLGEGTALRETLLAVRDAFRSHPRAGIACAIKNSGIGNGIPEPCDCYLEVHPAPEQPAGARLVLHHGWTEMGQGINTVARQMLCEVAELGPDVAIDMTASTEHGAFAGSTTASRGTFQLGHAVVNAARQLRGDLNKYGGRLDRLVGRFYKGHYDSAGQTSGQGAPGEIRNHVSYSFATHVVFMDEEGGIEKIIAAHDSGRVVNRPLYEGQVQGGVVMGMGYALTESIPVKGGYLTSGKLNACGLLRSVDVPEIEVIAVEVPDPEGPCGAKGIGEIACIPTAPAIVNALYLVDGVRRRELPVRKNR